MQRYRSPFGAGRTCQCFTHLKSWRFGWYEIPININCSCLNSTSHTHQSYISLFPRQSHSNWPVRQYLLLGLTIVLTTHNSHSHSEDCCHHRRQSITRTPGVLVSCHFHPDLVPGTMINLLLSLCFDLLSERLGQSGASFSVKWTWKNRWRWGGLREWKTYLFMEGGPAVDIRWWEEPSCTRDWPAKSQR